MRTALATLIVWLYDERFNARDGSRRRSVTFLRLRTSARCAQAIFCGAPVARECGSWCATHEATVFVTLEEIRGAESGLAQGCSLSLLSGYGPGPF